MKTIDTHKLVSVCGGAGAAKPLAPALPTQIPPGISLGEMYAWRSGMSLSAPSKK
jgi:hypothetical protein